MKILVVLYDLNSLSGLINNTENIVAGFQELGHTVDLVKLKWTNEYHGGGGRKLDAYTQGVLYPVSQNYGWAWPVDKVIPYKGKYNINKWKSFASKFDLIFWNIPVPTMRKSERGNSDWIELYDLPVPQVAYIHDAHMQRAYPYIYYVSQCFAGVGCVNISAFNNFKMDVPKILTLSPQRIDYDAEIIEYSHRKKGFIAPQTFKKWKHVDDLIRAIPFIPDDILKYIAGDGIERNYMTSPNKVKPIYLYEDGSRIWNVALDHGMRYLGYIHTDRRDTILKKIRTLVDPSWSHSFASYGGHFNRTVVEAIMFGAIPIATNLGMTGTEDGNNELFQAGHNYVMVPYNSSSEDYADIIVEANNMSSSRAARMQDNGFKNLHYWDRKFVCQQFIDLVDGKSSGLYKMTISKVPKKVIAGAEKAATEFFGI